MGSKIQLFCAEIYSNVYLELILRLQATEFIKSSGFQQTQQKEGILY